VKALIRGANLPQVPNGRLVRSEFGRTPKPLSCGGVLRYPVNRSEYYRKSALNAVDFLTVCYRFRPLFAMICSWWAQQDSNLRLPPCEGGDPRTSY
jgi:hypothetical protein